MAVPFGTPEWSRALESEINESSEYRNAGARWGDGFNGNMLFVFEADDRMREPLSLLIRLQAGECQGAEFLSGTRSPEAGFVLRAPFGLWKRVLDREVTAASAILKGQLQVEGAKMQLLKYTAAHRALVHCTASVDTSWDGLA